MSAPAPPPDGPAPFGAPWQARAFALVVALQDRGALGRDEWSRALGRAMRAAPGADGQEDPDAVAWRRWLAALEGLLAEKGLADGAELERRAAGNFAPPAAAGRDGDAPP